MKRFLGLLMACALFFSAACAEEHLDEFLYAETSEGMVIHYFMGDYERVVVPEKISGTPVTAIGENAFGSKTQLSELVVPSTVVSIAGNAFSGSPNVRLVVASGSAAEAYAMANGMPYVLQFPDFSVIPEGGVTPFSDAESVRKLQRMLVTAGLLSAEEISGVYSPATQTAVSNLQRYVGNLQGVSGGDSGMADEQTMVCILWYPFSNTPDGGVTPFSAPEEIRGMQEKLKLLGYAVELSGRYDLSTIEAVKAFQQETNGMLQSANVSVTGICDAQTLIYVEYKADLQAQAMAEASQSPSPSPVPSASPSPSPSPTATPEPTPEPIFPLTIESARKYQGRISGGDGHVLGLTEYGQVLSAGENKYSRCDIGAWPAVRTVAAGYFHTVGLLGDGSVIAKGQSEYGACDVGGWREIAAVAAGGRHTVGLRADGTVMAAGDNDHGQCNVGSWSDIVAVDAGCFFTMGLRSDGTVVTAGNKSLGQRNTGGWSDVKAIAAGGGHSVGLKANGTVVAVGDQEYGACNTGRWTDIVAVAAGGYHTVGLRSDGTVVAAGKTGDGACDVGWWTDIVAVAAGEWFTLGLRSDGTVLCTDPGFSVGYWKLH